MRRSPKLRPNLWDGVVALAVAALAVACAVGIWQGSGSQEALTAVISVDGTEVNSTEEVRAALNEHSTGEQMNMEIERDGNTIEVMVSL